MHPHHEETIRNVTSYFEKDPKVLALVLSGSIARGFEISTSDVDILIFLPEEDYQDHLARGESTFFSRWLATYPDGYVDGKYLSLEFLRSVGERGSEAARFAFQGVKVLFSRVDGFQEELDRATRYPLAGREERMVRFRAQVEAWRWFSSEARKRDNRYLLTVAVGKLVLFCGRLILAENKVLYPFHKWFMRVLEGADEKPAGLMRSIDRALEDPSDENVKALYDLVVGFREWDENATGWGAQFLVDSELNWIGADGAPLDDI